MRLPGTSNAARPAIRLGLATACSMLGTNATAAAINTGVEGFVFFALAYIVGLPVLLVAIALSHNRAMWSWVLAAYVGVPILAAAIGIPMMRADMDANNARAHEAERVGHARNVEALAAWCAERKRVVHARVPPGRADSLLVRFEEGFTGPWTEFGASSIRNQLRTDRAWCARTHLHFMEQYFKSNRAEAKAEERELNVYKICSREQASKAPESQARYELVLGGAGERRPVPWQNGARWLSRSSVRLVDLQSGATLAEDTMYFLRFVSSGEDGCPKGMEQLRSLIADVFPAE